MEIGHPFSIYDEKWKKEKWTPNFIFPFFIARSATRKPRKFVWYSSPGSAPTPIGYAFDERY